MSPQVQAARKKAQTPNTAAQPGPLSSPEDDRSKALAALKAEVEKNSDYVGMNFVAEARSMHEGEIPKRSIHGEAKFDEAKAMLEDGIPVAPLPFTPRAKTN